MTVVAWLTPERVIGAAIGAASGPAAGFGAAWSGMADGGWLIWVLATALGALFGALTWPIFVAPDTHNPGETPFPVGFAGLFGFAIGLLAGSLAAFPMGAVFGSLGGAVGGVSAGLAYHWLGRTRVHGTPWAPLLSSATGMTVGLLLLVGWTR